LINPKHNIKQFQIDLFDFNNNLLFSKQTNYHRENSIKLDDHRLFISTVQITILSTTDERPARGIILSIIGCFSTSPQISTTALTTTTIAPTTIKTTTGPPRIISSTANFLLYFSFQVFVIE
jgi:hypothetical protein